MEEKKKEVNTLLVCISLVVFMGVNTVLLKWVDRSTPNGIPYRYPIMQELFLAFGSALCGIPGMLTGKRLFPAKPFNWTLLLTISILTVTSNVVIYYGLMLVGAPTYLMLRSSLLIFTAVMAASPIGEAILGMRQHICRIQWVGITLSFAGIVNIVPLEASTGESQTSVNTFGCFVVLLATVCLSLRYLLEESLVKSGNIDALMLASWEGIVDGSVSIVWLFANTLLPPEYDFEDIFKVTDLLSKSNQTLVGLLGCSLCVFIFNPAGIYVSKVRSASYRLLLDSIRIAFVWTTAVVLGWSAFYPLQLVYFCAIVGGFGIYHANHHTRKERIDENTPLLGR
eukprot:TRINITY_DN30616_c0_g1_i1.p1 TRINITY_DN30616_c0_g1~~TRINITY_DN30616_c0_g1_i1.p1  ORF type:complete len:340 (+),score=62.00 TRINITY_DN30616_c0_g1_i1:98-1117(+)